MKAINRKPVKNNARVISSVGASMAMEGLQPSSHARTVGKQYLENKITAKEAVAKVKAKHASNFRTK